MNLKLIGSILLITGTSIGGGLLALPAATASTGSLYSIILIVITWLITGLAALYILEVNLCLPSDTNLVSMAYHTLGRFGGIICWISYLVLLYSLISVYTSGGTDLLNSMSTSLHLTPHSQLSSIIFIVVLGAIVWCGIGLVDKTNRALMSIKMLSFLILVVLLLPRVDMQHLSYHDASKLSGALMPIIFSFGYSIIVPSLRAYLDNDAKKVRLAIIIGSTIPMISYIAWICAVHGTVDHELLVASNHSGEILSTLNKGLGEIGHTTISFIGHLFTGICVFTSFLGVSLSTSDFLADGMQLKKQGVNKIPIYAATFLPPLIIVIFRPHIYMTALRFAGILCVIILILLPAAMAMSNRVLKKNQGYKAPGGKGLVLTILLLSIVLLIYAVIITL
ncbi:MAG: aromatic amino acid transport family protein [Pseudomonadota bacterium]